MDVNLRAPWWERASVLALLRDAAVIKLNEGELLLLLDSGPRSEGSAPPPRGPEDVEREARTLLEESGAGRIVVTRGEAGALAIDRESDPISGAAPPVAEVVDTVGAGDAFSAALILGECRGWEPRTALSRSLDFAAAFEFIEEVNQ